MIAAVHTLRYIKNNPSQGLIFNNKSNYSLQAYSNSNWVQCPCTRKSVNGYFLMLGGSAISWKLKKQLDVSLSFAEAEHRSKGGTLLNLLGSPNFFMSYKSLPFHLYLSSAIAWQPFILQKSLFSISVPNTSNWTATLWGRNSMKVWYLYLTPKPLSN